MNSVLPIEQIKNNDLIVSSDNWHARLELEYKKSKQKTILSHRLHKGPLVVQKAFYPEMEVCHSYLIHPPGGIVGGDILELDIILHQASHVLITTPAANKFYRSDNKQATLKQSIKIKRDATLEWLPQETIFYNQCNAAIHTEFDLEDNVNLICWEINCFGRPAGNELFEAGIVKQKISIIRNGIPLYIDRNIVESESNILEAAWGLNKFPVMATMIVTLATLSDKVSKNEFNLDTVEQLQQHSEKRIVSITQRDDLLLIRYFGYHAREALAILTECWGTIRPKLLQKKSCAPRIWAT